jgi:Asp-tRNA(Asn)/Glu-tRNA(Gln) amidotransferase A subunit family amidase
MEACDLNAAEARRLMAQKSLSVMELAQSCITRMNAVNHAVNAIVACDLDDLMAQAKQAQKAIEKGKSLGALHGLSLGVKDMVDLKGFPTTFGSTIYKDNMATSDDPMVAQLRQAGALPLGKTNNPEWSAGGNTRNAVYGATANPFDVTRSAAGSSGGSAVALACGMISLATGSDTGGSLRNPAAFCGVVGFRPSPGVVPGHSRPIGLIPLPTNGPMARSVEDIGLMLSQMIRPDRRDPWVSVVEGCGQHNADAYRCLPDFDLSSAKVAFTNDFGFAMTENLIKESFQEKIDKFGSVFAQCDNAHPSCDHADHIFAVLRALNFSGHHRDLSHQYPGQMGPNILMNIAEGESYSALDVVSALNKQTIMYRAWQMFFEEYDFILAPTTTISPRDWHELYPEKIDGKSTQSYYHWLSMAYASTLTGHPSVTLPVGRDKNNMPFGLQIIGRRGDDLSTLAFAKSLEALLAKTPDLARPRVDIAMLSGLPALKNADGFMGF